MLKVYEELRELIEKTLKAIDKAYDDGKINISDYDIMNTVIENLNSYLLNMYGKYRDFEEEVRDMVKSFYDPKIEEKGRNEEKEKGRLRDIERVQKYLVKKFAPLDEEVVKKIKLAKEENLNLLLDNIFDINSLEEAVRYLS